MAQQLPFWKRKFNVHQIQRKYFYLSLVPLVVCSFLLIFLVTIPLYSALRTQVPDLQKAASLAEIYGMGGFRIWVAIFTSMIVSGLLSYVVTNKFAGPIFRIEQILRKSKEGEFPLAVRIRRGDDLQEFAGLLDDTFKRVTTALTAIDTQKGLAFEKLSAIRGKVNAEANGEIVRDLEGIGRHLKEVETALANFKFPADQAPPPEPAGNKSSVG